MPYESEYANSLGYESFLSNEFVSQRISTFKRAQRDEYFDNAIDRGLVLSGLGESGEGFPQWVGIDGSRAASQPDSGVELAALQWAIVSRPSNERIFDHQLLTSVFPVLGFDTDSATPTRWSAKLREEIFENFKHYQIPQCDNQSLLDLLQDAVPQKTHFYCTGCALEDPTNRSWYELNLSKDGIGECRHCFETVYLTDHLISNDLKMAAGQGVLLQRLMLFVERLVGHAIASQNEDTLVVVDGPLSLYGSYYPFNSVFLQDSNRISRNLVGFEKSGRMSDFATYLSASDHLDPGSVMMITTDTLNLIMDRNARRELKKVFHMGRYFIYRTQDGLKTFVFMAPPSDGLAYSTDEPVSDEWTNYPVVPAVCAFIENEKTDAFGLAQPSLDLISEANFAASLPKNLSEIFLSLIVFE